MKTLDFRGTGKLIRFYMRQNWITRAIWLLTPALLLMAGFSSYGVMFATQQELNAFVGENVLNPVVSAIHGFILSRDVPGIVSWNIKTVSLIVIAIFNILAVSKIARGEEETGRADLLQSCMVGRQSRFAAAVIISYGANVVMGVLLFVTMLALGFPPGGSLTLSLLLAVGGCLFASIGALTSQLAAARRTASSLAIGLMGLLYMLSFMNNLSADNNISSYLTPFRWFFVVRPFAGDNSAFLLAGVLLALAIAAAGLLLSDRRDVGAGAIQPKAGRSAATSGFNNVFALGWRMQRGPLITWALALGIFAFGIGSVDPLVTAMISEQPTLAAWMQLFGKPEEAFLSLMLYVLCLFAAAYGVLAAQRLRSEETEGRVELLLSTAAARTKWMASHLLLGAAGSALIMLVVGLCVAAGSVAGGGGAEAFGKIVLMALVKLPAVLVMAGIAALAFGLLPKISTGLSWGIYSLLILIQLLWEMGLVPELLFKLSPFGQVYPTQPQTPAVFMLLLAVAAVFYGAGVLCFKRRDIQG